MLTRIIKHEWRNLLAERAFWPAAMLVILLTGYGAFNGAAWVERQRRLGEELLAEREQKIAEAQRQLLETSAANGSAAPLPASAFDPSDPYDVGAMLQNAVLPFAPLAALSVGQSDLLPNHTGVSVLSKQRTYADKAGFENPLNLLAGRFDLAFVIVYLYPLLILALSYNLLSAEREQGTLALLLSQPLALRTVALGKLGQRALTLWLLLLGFVPLALLAVGVDLGVEGAPAKLLLWVAVALGYGMFWFSLALAINALGKNSATNAFALIGCWLAFVLIIPALLNVAVKAAYPVPSRTELIATIRDVQLDVRRDGSRLLTEFYQDHPEMIPPGKEADMSNFGLASLTIQQEHRKRAGEVEKRFNVQLARQQDLVNRFRLLSPAILAQEALNELAGTGVVRYQNFRRQVDEFDAAWSAFFLPRIYRQEKLTDAEYVALPRFSFVEEAFAVVAGRVLFGLLGALLPAAALLAFGLRRLRRYAVQG